VYIVALIPLHIINSIYYNNISIANRYKQDVNKIELSFVSYNTINKLTIMNTRSQTKKALNIRVLYEVNIDFDEAINAWNKNKKSIGNGQYKYVCLQEKQCSKKICYCYKETKTQN
jgi:hypothetical protein